MSDILEDEHRQAQQPADVNAGAPTMTQCQQLTHGPSTKSPPVSYTSIDRV